VPYFNLQMPENNPGWRTKWFYAKDKSSAGENFGLEEFKPPPPFDRECLGGTNFLKRR
jgi:hypothetical protein